MMRKYAYIFLIVALLLISKNAEAFWGLAIDSYPMPDFVDEAASYIQGSADLANKTQKDIKTTQDNINNLRAAAKSVYNGEMSTLINNYSLQPGQKPMETCMYLGKQYKNDSADNVYDLIKILFLQYPSNDTLERQQYDNYKEEFYKDTVIEIFTAAGALQEELEKNIQPAIDKSIGCIKGERTDCGNDNTPEGNNDAIFMEGLAFKTVDNLYQTLLKVTALKAQFIAAKVIYQTKPLAYVEGVKDQTADTSGAAEEAAAQAAAAEEATGAEGGSEQSTETQAFAFPLSKVYAQAAIHHSELLSFAQVGMTQSKKSSVLSLSQVESAVTLSNDKSQQYVDGALTFVVPDASPEKHAYIYEEDKMAELDKLEPIDEEVNKARDVHNLIHGLSDYKNAAESVQEMREKYEKALISLKKADSCAKSYIGRHFSNASSVWGGGANVTDYDSRSGISGWAYKAYEAAKAAETTETSSSDIIAMDIDYENVDLSDPTDTKKNMAEIEDQGSLSPGKSKEEKAVAEARASRMLSWQIGSEASKMLAADSAKWGKELKTPAFSVWQDVKSFYNQYLDKKYANIKSYLTSFTKNDVLAVVAERLKGGEASIDNTLRRKEAVALEEQLSTEIQEADSKGEQTLSGYEEDYQSGLAALQAQRKALVSRLDNASAELKTESDVLSDLRNQAREDAGATMREKVTAKEDFPSSLEASPSGNTSIAAVEDYEELSASFSSNVSENKASSGIEEQEKKVERQKQVVSSLDKQLEELDNKIKSYRLKAQSGILGLRLSREETKSSLIKQATEMLSKSDGDYAKDVKSNLLSILQDYPLNQEVGLIVTPETVYQGLENSAQRALDTLYSQVEERVNQARKQISALGDNLYNPEYHEQIDQIHQSMIKDIKAMAISVNAIGISAIRGIELYGKLLTADTSAEEEDYFVGRPAKARDLKAPKEIFIENLPPLREVFHFDETDFQNVKPFVEGNTKTSTILNSDFLNVGGEIPKVWQYMLRSHSYVEADMDLKKALNEGCAQVSFFRGGAMPCKVKNSAIIVDMDGEGNYIRSSATGDLPECSYIEARSGNIYHTRREVSIKLGNGEGENSKDCAYSELGTLFEANDEGNLLFRQPTYNAYYTLLDELNNSEDELSNDKKKKLAAYDRAPLAFNQIGEFLVYAENERNMKEQLEEAEKQYNELLEKLYATLREYGYEPSSSLDLAKESDYNLVRNKLNNIKNSAITEALSQIEEIDIVDNDVVTERIESLKNIISALQKDKEEMTIIGGVVEDQNNLDEEIKTSKVNEDVADKFINSLNKASDSINLPEAPYCATY